MGSPSYKHISLPILAAVVSERISKPSLENLHFNPLRTYRRLHLTLIPQKMAGRFKELIKKYGKVGLGVHVSVSAASITGLYVAIKNNVDVESMLQRFGMPCLSKDNDSLSANPETISDSGFSSDRPVEKKGRNRTAELAASSGGALALAVLINKALLPVRVPITLALTPPIARFLARRNLIKHNL